MSESTACLNARAALAEIRAIKQDFDTAFDAAVASGTPEAIAQAQTIKQAFETKIKALQETLGVVSVERLFNLKEQYEAQINQLTTVGLLTVEEGFTGITGIDGIKYPVPSYEQLVARLAERKEFMETKADQGFTKLMVVPFGMSLDSMREKLKEYLLAYKKTHPAFTLDENDPLYVWDLYNGADVSGELVYNPASFDANHGGTTKKDILAEQTQNKDTTVGYEILLVQHEADNQGIYGIPRSGQGLTQGTKNPRPDIEAGKTPREYLAEQQATSTKPESPYAGESGMTPEAWMVMFMDYLTETGRPLDDYGNNKDSISYLTGAYFKASDYVPNAYWDRDNQRANLIRSNPGNRDENCGVRSPVRV